MTINCVERMLYTVFALFMSEEIAGVLASFMSKAG